ncbi:hypothetical protein HWD97_22125 [Ochrobactrum sp. C6C9]|nr:hypothetical protein [Ochrobactrum sp. C6C9]
MELGAQLALRAHGSFLSVIPIERTKDPPVRYFETVSLIIGGMVMIRNGFDMRLESDMTWCVYDVFNGEIVSIEGHKQSGLSESDAKEAVDLLNRKYIERHQECGSGRLP